MLMVVANIPFIIIYIGYMMEYNDKSLDGAANGVVPEFADSNLACCLISCSLRIDAE